MAAPAGNAPPFVRFHIEDKASLEKAIAAAASTKGGPKGQAIVRIFIMKRARALKLESLIPSSWMADGTVKA